MSTFPSSLVMPVGLQNLVVYRNPKFLSNNKNTSSYVLNYYNVLYKNIDELLYLILKTVWEIVITVLQMRKLKLEGVVIQGHYNKKQS